MQAQPVQLVSTISQVFMCITLLICIALPIGMAIWGRKKFRKAFSFIPMLAGVLAFFTAQVVFRQYILGTVLSQFGWYKSFAASGWAFLIYSCFLAGLVEEPARFVAFSVMKHRRQFPDGLSYGIGHGGVEVLLVTGLAYLNNILVSVMINSGYPDVPAEVTNLFIATPPADFLLAGLERVFAMALQIALSLLVLKGFQVDKKAQYLAGAILLHGAANFAAAATAQLAGNLASEGVLLIVAAASVLYIVRQAKEWMNQPAVYAHE